MSDSILHVASLEMLWFRAPCRRRGICHQLSLHSPMQSEDHEKPDDRSAAAISTSMAMKANSSQTRQGLRSSSTSRKFNFQSADMSPRSRREFFARGLPKTLALESEGAGNAGRSMHPQPGGQKRVDSHTSSSHHEITGRPPAFPAQWFTAASFVLLCPQNLSECANGRFSPTARRWI
jgi:hypothetical protein